MRTSKKTLPGLLIAGLLMALPARAQFVSMGRCHSALPCSIPFGLQYNPDPLIAGQYGQPTPTIISGRVPLKFPLRVELDKPFDQKALDEALRKSLVIHERDLKAPAAAAAEEPRPGKSSPEP